MSQSISTALARLLLGAALLTAILALPAQAQAQEQAGEPRRIVTIGAPLTEIVHALGVGEAVVGTDLTSRHPTAAATVPKVGYMRALSAEGMLSLAPDLIIASDQAGPPEVLNQIRAAGVRLELVPEVPTLEGLRDKIATVATLVGRSEAGAALVADLDARLHKVETLLAASGPKPRVLFLLSIANGPPQAAGRDSVPDILITLAGGTNAVDGFPGFRPVSVEAATVAAPDVIMVTATTYDQMGGTEGILALPQVAITPAARSGRVVALDGPLLVGLGPRTPDALMILARAFHPDLVQEAGQ